MRSCYETTRRTQQAHGRRLMIGDSRHIIGCRRVSLNFASVWGWLRVRSSLTFLCMVVLVPRWSLRGMGPKGMTRSLQIALHVHVLHVVAEHRLPRRSVCAPCDSLGLAIGVVKITKPLYSDLHLIGAVVLTAVVAPACVASGCLFVSRQYVKRISAPSARAPMGLAIITRLPLRLTCGHCLLMTRRRATDSLETNEGAKRKRRTRPLPSVQSANVSLQEDPSHV